jgi:hypothetical protein
MHPQAPSFGNDRRNLEYFFSDFKYFADPAYLDNQEKKDSII